jgi:hypothetical protein
MSAAETVYFRCIPDLVSYDRNLPFQARYLFVMIAHEVHLDTGRVQITTEHLADVSGVSVSTVLRYVPILEEHGYIRVTRAPKGSKIPNIYEIIGTAAEIVVRKGKAEESPSSGGEARPTQVARNQSTGQHVSNRLPTSLNAQMSERQSSAPNRQNGSQIDTSRSRTAVGGNAPTLNERPDQLSQSQLTKQREQMSEEIEESVVQPSKETPIFYLEGVHPSLMQEWIDYYGSTRMREVMERLSKAKNVANKGGWVRAALENGWEFGRARGKNGDSGKRDFLSGRYAEFIKH